VYRVWYQASGFGTGKVVTAKCWDSATALSIVGPFREVGSGMYYLDWTPPKAGRYAWVVMEDGIPKKSGVLTFTGNAPTCGDNMADTLIVSVADAKRHLRVTNTQDDSYIEGLILAVQDYAAAWQGRTWLQATLTQVHDAFPWGDAPIYLRCPPLVSITKIEYVDVDGVTQELANTVYRKDIVSEPGRITLEYAQVWPATRSVTNAVTITYVAGYAAAVNIKQTWKQAVLLGVGHLYNHRESVSETTMVMVPMAFYDLLSPDRVFSHDVRLESL